MRRRIHLLIGAHKTASTHLQRSLGDHAAALSAKGVAVVGPMPLGADLINFAEAALNRTSPDIMTALAELFLSKHCGAAQTCILMNENMMGQLRPRPLLRRSRLYAPAPDRMARIASMFAGHDVQIGLALRHPASFLVSAWGEDMKGGAFYPFSDYIKGVDLAQLSWARLVRDIQKATGGLPMTLWRFEDYPAVAPALLKHLMGDAGAGLNLRGARVNSGLSGRAVAHLAQTGDAGAQAFRAAQESYPKSDKHPPFDPWTPEQRARFDASYAEDWQALRGMQGITALG